RDHEARLKSLAAEAAGRERELIRRIDNLYSREAKQQEQSIEELRGELEARATAQEKACQELRAQLKETGVPAHQNKVFGLQQSFRMAARLKRLQSYRLESQDSAAAQTSPGGDWTDQLILDHADVFRGTRTDILDRLRIYLPHVRRAAGGSALDLGCGRGE